MRERDTSPSILHRLAWWLAAILLIASPFAIGWGVMQAENASFTDLFPLYSDEIYYWHQAATFAQVGFANGQYSIGEIPAQIGRYHAWGLAAPILYGTMGHIAGWPLWAIPVANLVLVTLALMLWVSVARPDIKQILAALFFLGMFAPFVTQVSSSMFEFVQYAWAIVLAAALWRVLQQPPRSRALRWGLLALGLACFVALFRVTWSIIIPIVGALALRHRGKRGILVGWVIGVGLAAVMYIVYTRTAAPYSEYVPQFKAFANGVRAGLEAVQSHIAVNIDLFLHGEPIEMSLRLQVLVIWCLLCVGFVVRKIAQRRQPDPRPDHDAVSSKSSLWNAFATDDPGEVMLHTFLLMGQLFLIIVVYDVGSWRDYRLLSGHVVLSGFLLIGRRRWGVLAAVLLISLLTLPLTLSTTREWTQEYLKQQRIVSRLEESNPQIDAVVQYDSTLSPALCNTVTHTVYFGFISTHILLAIEPGIGLTILLSDADVHLPFQAHYLLLDNDFITRYSSQLHVEFLLSVPGGVLYRNLDAPCNV
jgi:hypothetical protein